MGWVACGRWMHRVGVLVAMGMALQACGPGRRSGGGWNGTIDGLDGEPIIVSLQLWVDDGQAGLNVNAERFGSAGSEVVVDEEWDGTALRDGDGWDLSFEEAGWTGRCEGFRDTQLDCTGSDGGPEVSVVLNPRDVPLQR